MARGRDRHQERLQAVSRLGRTLARRASSRCELCEARTGLRASEVPPTAEEPDLDRMALLCPRCLTLAEGGKLPRDTDDLRFLEGAVWSETLPVQLLAVRLTRRLSEADVPWAQEAIEGLWLEDEIQALVDA